MPHVLARLADGLLARLVPHTEVAAGCRPWADKYETCYCSRGLRYRRDCSCRHLGTWRWLCTRCYAAGTC